MLLLKFIPTHWFHDIFWFRTSWSTPRGGWEPTAGDSAVMYFGWGPGCQSVWELHPCSISGLWAVVFSVCEPFCSFFSFLSFLAFWFPISLTVASLQGVAQDFMLSCNHRLTLSLSPVISMSLKSPAATAASSSSRLTQSWFCIAVVFLLALFYSFIYSFICFLGGSILCIPLSVCWLAFLFFLVVRHATLPSARHALYHGSVLRLFTVLWLVSGSQSCSCAAVSVSSMLWLVFRVDHVHKAPQLPGLTWTHPRI